VVAIIFALANPSSSRLGLSECSIRLKGCQMNDAIGRGVTEGGVLSEIGLTSLEQDE